MLHEIELAEHGGGQETHHVRERGDLEIGPPGLFRDRGAADDVAALEDDDAAAPLREQAGGHEPVVSSPDDDDIEAVRARHGPA